MKEKITRELIKDLKGERPHPIVITTDLFWDCECDTDYINYTSEAQCFECGCIKDESPDSRLIEVVDMLITKSHLLEDPNFQKNPNSRSS